MIFSFDKMFSENEEENQVAVSYLCTAIFFVIANPA